MTKRLLFALAHPDDESFGSGAFISRCTSQGIEVSLICATNGDVGTVSAEKMNGYKTVAELRTAELDCAAQVLGLKEVIKFGYRDSGMMGSADNNDPQALWQADPETLIQQVIEVMERIRPQVVVTFNKFGGYGHPDHIKIQQATAAAFNRLQGQPNAPQKLYYSSFPMGLLKMGVFFSRLAGRDPRKMGVNKDVDFMAVLEAVEPVHARISVKAWTEQGQKAADCHASQISPRAGFPLARLYISRAMQTAGFTRVVPEPRRGEPIESDLFAGVREREV
ncbi:MAG: PIG-L family deacetylase [Anaerolineae bacterium]